MGYILQYILVLFSTVLFLLTLKLVRFFYREWRSPLNILPGPPSPSWIFGNMKQTWAEDHCLAEERWLEEYTGGEGAVRYKGFIGMNQLFTTDLKALNHIMTNSYDYQKPAAAVKSLERIVGPGLLVVEGDTHKRQRKVMNPAFGSAQIREFTEIFIDKAIELRDIWDAQISGNGKRAEEEGKAEARLDALSWLSRMTLDVIGLAGFHYHFDALAADPRKNELNNAFSTIFETGMKISVMSVLRTRIPFLRYVPSERTREFDRASQTMKRIGNRLLEESKETLTGSIIASSISEKVSRTGRDLLSTLVRANLASDVLVHQRLSDEEVVAQVATSLVAGHETTSTGTTWALFALTQNRNAQKKLRAELIQVETDNPSMDELNSFKYLDAFVRECLRLYPPIPSKVRVVMKDDVLPLSKPIVGRNGEMINCIQIKKGQMVSIPIMSVNRSKSIWGEDARQFRPERWQDFKLPEGISVPGIWGNMLTFLGGPRSCIGYRFSLIEMKALLFTLVRAFEFELAVPAEDIAQTATIVLRPSVRSDANAGNQMPLLIRRVTRRD